MNPQDLRKVFDPFDLVPLADGWELEKLAVFGVCVAGKSASTVWPKVQELLDPKTWWDPACDTPPIFGPFETLDWLSQGEALVDALRKVKMGQYARIGGALASLGALRRDWNWKSLLEVPGVNLKTAKMVQLYTAPGGRCACLDVHVLRAMKAWPAVKKLQIKVPDAAPNDPHLYAVLEALFLVEADARGVAPWSLDKELWRGGVASRARSA